MYDFGGVAMENYPLVCPIFDSVAQLVRAWQANCQVTGSSLSLSHCLFFPSLLLLLSLFLTFLFDFDLG